MGISLHTLRGHTEAMRHKLGARTIAHAVALGLKSETIQGLQ
jgi:DNA-binding CsgD family transcriptional regulator